MKATRLALTLRAALWPCGWSRHPAGRLGSVTETRRPMVAPEAWTVSLHSWREEITLLGPSDQRSDWQAVIMLPAFPLDNDTGGLLLGLGDPVCAGTLY